MVTIAIVAPSSVPYQVGGAEKFWHGLQQALSLSACPAVELIKLPAPEQSFKQILQSYKAFSQLDLSHFDLVISTKYPAWMVHHHHHVCYLQHTLRGLYDTYRFTHLPEYLNPVPPQLKELMALVRKAEPTRDHLSTAYELIDRALGSKTLSSDLFAHPGPLVREVVHFFDRIALSQKEIHAYLAISRNVSQRKDYFPASVPIRVLPHPSDLTHFANTAQDYFFTASRLNKTKRVSLIVEAMRYVEADIPLLIAGTGDELTSLQDLAGGDPRIRFLNYVPDQEMSSLYAGALAVPFVPYDEDYGLITIEAMHSSKPVITAKDSGGPCEWVEDGETGFICEPTPEALGLAMNRLAQDKTMARIMGEKARTRVSPITWPKTVKALLEHIAQASVHKQGDKKKCVLVLSTYPAKEDGNGGARRLHHLCQALSNTMQVLLICYDQKVWEGHLFLERNPRLKELHLSFGPAEKNAMELEARYQVSAGDIALMRTCSEDPELAHLLEDLGQNAHCAVLAHPYLYPALRRHLPDLPFIYDAHNVEADLKAQLLPSDLAAEVALTEEACARMARAVLACSREDAKRLAYLYALAEQKLQIMPNGCDLADPDLLYSTTQKELRRRLDYPEAKLALFLGSAHQPNLQACTNILKMASALPSVHFLIAGGVSTHPKIRKIPAPKNVHLLGIVSEAVKNVLIRAADLGLHPVTTGSGTNLKLVDYLALGLETISTPFGLRGLEPEIATFVHRTDLNGFPKSIEDALKNPMAEEKRTKIAQIVRKRLSWSVVFRDLPGLLEKVGKYGETLY